MDRWPNETHLVKAGYPPADVRTFCVRDDAWQERRLCMKGKPTAVKLDLLLEWWMLYHRNYPYKTEVQVGNYLGALRRGGQLDMGNKVRKYL